MNLSGRGSTSISAVEYDRKGEFLATGDTNGSISLFKIELGPKHSAVTEYLSIDDAYMIATTSISHNNDGASRNDDDDDDYAASQ